MKRNMGNADRLARMLVVGVIAALYLNGNITGILSYILLAVGGIFLVTSVIGVCPLYSLFGFKTCRNGKADKIY